MARPKKTDAVTNAGAVEGSSKRYFYIHGFTPLLGSQPADPEVRATWISSRAPKPELAEEEALANLEGEEDKGCTVFPRHPEKKCMMLWDYMLRGYVKSAMESTAQVNGVKMVKSKVDKYVFVSPRRILLKRGGAEIYGEDMIRERPLRAETMRGPRVTLAASEQIDPPWDIKIGLELIGNNGTASSKAISWDAVIEALNFGYLQGLGQWRSGGNGRFCWEELDDHGNVIEGSGNMELYQGADDDALPFE